MKYKNYINSKTNDNRIYTSEELKNMSMGEIFRRKEEILAQNRVIGVPSESELRSSSNVVYVHEYTREDGTHVRAHWRSRRCSESIVPRDKNKREDGGCFPQSDENPSIEDIFFPKKDTQDKNHEQRGGNNMDMNFAGGEILLKAGQLILNTLQKISVEALKTVVLGAKDLVVEVASKIPVEQLKTVFTNVMNGIKDFSTSIKGGVLTGGAAKIGEDLGEISDMVLQGGVEFNDFIDVVDEALSAPAKDISEIFDVIKEGLGKVLETGKAVAEEVGEIIKTVQLPQKQEDFIKILSPVVVKEYPEQEYYKIAYELKKAKQTGKVQEWVFDHNTVQKVKNIKNKKLNNFVKNKLYKSIMAEHNNGDINNVDDIYVVVPKYDSDITEIIKNDSGFINKIKSNMDAIKNGEYTDKAMSYNFNSSKFMSPLDSEKHFSTHNTIGHCDIYDIKIDSDGYISMIIVDYYDFDKSGNIIVNNAYQKQLQGNLENYVLLIPIRFKLESI